LRLTMIALASLALSAADPLAYAADLPPAPILDDTDEPDSSGWYLRGDIGAMDRILSRGGRDFGSASLPPLVRARFDRDLTVGGGVGYRLSPWFRADVTVDHRFGATFNGTRFASVSNHALDRADLDATTFLVNGYVDLDLWSGITPYLGAGIGVSRNRFAAPERQTSAPDGTTIILPLTSRTENVLAWALMAGVAVELSANLKIDLGYRYTHLGNVNTRPDGPDALIRAKDMGAHEFRIGARYMLD
jgi:opacity protein-like surface antigen